MNNSVNKIKFYIYMNSKEIFFFITYTRKAKENPNEIDFVEPKKKN